MMWTSKIIFVIVNSKVVTFVYVRISSNHLNVNITFLFF